MQNALTNNSNLDDKISLFFHDPLQNIQGEDNIIFGPQSSLYLLRRDAKICMDQNNENGKIAPWAATSVILTGIDLLAQYFCGSNTPGEVGCRFKKYCRTIMGLSEEEATALYALRNTFVHSYGLMNENNLGELYYFTVTYKEPQGEFIKIDVTENKKRVTVDLFSLYSEFEISIENYREKLAQNQNGEVQKFIIMFETYPLVGPDPFNNTMTGSAPITWEAPSNSINYW